METLIILLIITTNNENTNTDNTKCPLHILIFVLNFYNIANTTNFPIVIIFLILINMNAQIIVIPNTTSF